ncbi:MULTISPECIES: DoxX family protein [Haloferax]|uniref:DoxX family membrane protein n=1 Tax=Haloferax marinum TaxID=2666143 RepID=A0A6A8G9T0_9EURY|nr:MULTISPECIES: DoxX family protein [Haloferax]KAB1197808.1 DoxX family protein [Haloferax sp. CBA1150]MRW96866.1 DoxX family membrane protein [Haloferax marinum]
MAATGQIEMMGNRLEFDYSENATGYVLVLTRLITGYWFLHAGIGKYMAAEPFDAAGWLVNATGGSPIHGFLAWAGQTPWMLEFTNIMIPLGEALIGFALLVGVLTRLAAFFGGVLMAFFYLGNAAWSHGMVNGDLFGLMMFVIVGTLAAGRILGLDTYIEEMEFVKQRPKLKYLLG